MVFTAQKNSQSHQLTVCVGMLPIQHPRNLHDWGGGIVGQHYTDEEFLRTFKIPPPKVGEEFWLLRVFPEFKHLKLDGHENSGGVDGEGR